jgi:nicotinamidase-related amidase
MNIELLIIDPQKDFCTEKEEVNGVEMRGALFVPGANEDMIRVAEMIDRIGPKINDIHATLDSHHYVDIAHPVFWINSKGQNPDPFTIISNSDVKNGIWRATNPAFQNRAAYASAFPNETPRDGVEEYTSSLESNGRYPLCIWPPHCLIASWGYSVHSRLYESLLKWEKDFAIVDYVTKGSNFWTEHYSAVQADVPDPQDPTTMLNNNLIDTLEKADIILLAGEARSHCLANTVTDIADNFGDENIKKMVLLKDATTDVPNPPGTTMFTDMGEAFVKNLTTRGMQISTTTEFLK